MNRKLLSATFSLMLAFLLIGCNTNTVGNSGEPNENSEKDETNAEELENNNEEVIETNEENEENKETEQLSMRELSDRIIKALDEQDMEAISKHVHEEKGLLFSPYVYVKEDAVVLEKSEVATMLDHNEKIEWGLYDGKGTPIELTAKEYFEEFLDMTPYLQPDEVLENDMQDRGNTINNITEAFPDAEVIEYYHEGSEEYAGIDWSSTLLVYEHDKNGALQLVAIIRDMWTI